MVGFRDSGASHLRLVPEELNVQEGNAADHGDGAPEYPFGCSLRAKRRSLSVSYRISLQLDGISTQVSRRIIVNSDVTLDHLHSLVQRTMGWRDMHGHTWRKAGTRFPGDFEEYVPLHRVSDRRGAGQIAVAENEIRLDEILVLPGDKIQYRYGRLGSWRHTLILDAVDDCDIDVSAICVEGVGACPPEACVGPEEYEQLLGVLVSEELRSREWTLEWAQTDFDPENFDLDEVNDRLSRCVGTAKTESVVASFPRNFDIRDLFELLAPASVPELHDVFEIACIDDTSEISNEVRVEAGARLQMLLTLIGAEGIDVATFDSTVDAVLDQPELGPVNLPKARRLFVLLRGWGLARKLKGKIVLTRRGRSASEDAEVLWDCIVTRVPVAPHGSTRAVELLILLSVAAGLDPSDRHHLVAGSLSQIRASVVLTSEAVVPVKRAHTTVEVLDLIGAIGQDLLRIGSTQDMPWAVDLARAVLQR
ncbi:pRiA4b ORF-3-like protein [Rhodococcus sp. OK302]|nr:pRiA4b ORF-3-like protein [Rhodococcus sp. OK302]